MTLATVRAIRGAISCETDTPADITEATQTLLRTMIDRNELLLDDVISVFFTTTPDLVAQFPASAARAIGFDDVALMCASEIDVVGAMAKVIRVLMHVYTTRSRADVRHVFLRGAAALRRDLD
jgi:chorismate mutase